MVGLVRVVDTLEAARPGAGEFEVRAELGEVTADNEPSRARLTEYVAVADEFRDRLRGVASAGSALTADSDGSGTGALTSR